MATLVEVILGVWWGCGLAITVAYTIVQGSFIREGEVGVVLMSRVVNKK